MTDRLCTTCMAFYFSDQWRDHSNAPCSHCHSTEHKTCDHMRLQQIDDAWNAALQRGALAEIERMKARVQPAAPTPVSQLYCLNCRHERPATDGAWHSAPCSECGSDGHARCQHHGGSTQ